VDSCQASQISGITDEFVNLQTLSMTNNELTSLKGFPKLPNLRKVCRRISDLADWKYTIQFAWYPLQISVTVISSTAVRCYIYLFIVTSYMSLQGNTSVFYCEVQDTVSQCIQK